MGRTFSITMPSTVGILGRAPAVNKKVWCFFVCLSVCFLSRFGMTKFVITETLWSSIIFKTIMVSLHRGRFVVVQLCSSFPIDLRIFPEGQIFTQNYHFGDFWGRKVIFWSYSGEIWHKDAVLGLPPKAKYCKNRLRGYTPFGQIYNKFITKNTNFGNFGGCNHTFLTHSNEIWHEGANLWLPSPR